MATDIHTTDTNTPTSTSYFEQDVTLPVGFVQRKLSEKAQVVHEEVTVIHKEACERRLSFLRELIENGLIEEAIDLSFALKARPEYMDASCLKGE